MTPLAPASASRVATAPAVAAADDLVRVGHRHERQPGPGGADPAQELDRARRASRRPRAPSPRRAGGSRRRPAGRSTAGRPRGGRPRRRPRRARPRSSSRRRDSRPRRTGRGPPGRRPGPQRRRPRSAARRRCRSCRAAARVRRRARRRAGHPCALRRRFEVAEVLVAPAAEAEEDERLVRIGAPGSLDAGEEPRQDGDGVGGLERRQDALGGGAQAHAGHGLVIGGRRELDPAGDAQRGDLRADPRVVEPGAQRVGLDDLAVAVLEHERARAVEDAGRAAGDRRRVLAGRDPLPRRLGDREADRGLADEPAEEPDRVRAAADAGEGEVGQAPLDRFELGGRLVADPPLEVADDRRVRVRAHRRPEHVVGRLDVRDPVAHRLVDGVLEGRRAARDRAGPRRPGRASGGRSGPAAGRPRRPCRRRTAGRAGRRRSRSPRRAGRRPSRR